MPVGLAFGALDVMRAYIEQDKLASRPADLTFRGAALGTPLDFYYSVTGVILWLVIVLVLSALASLWPALGSARVSARESLAVRVSHVHMVQSHNHTNQEEKDGTISVLEHGMD